MWLLAGQMIRIAAVPFVRYKRLILYGLFYAGYSM